MIYHFLLTVKPACSIANCMKWEEFNRQKLHLEVNDDYIYRESLRYGYR